MKSKFTIIFLIIIFSINFVLNNAFAVNEASLDLIQLYQSTNEKIDRFINMITLLATVFGVIIAIVVAFFTIRQIYVDKEVNAYKEDIKQQRDSIREETTLFKKELVEDSKWVKSKKVEIEKALAKPLTSQTKSDLEKLKKQVDALQEEIAFKRGSISASSVVTGYQSGFQSALSSVYGDIIVCKKCGQSYPKETSLGVMSDISKVAYISPLLSEETKSTCPYCDNIN